MFDYSTRVWQKVVVLFAFLFVAGAIGNVSLAAQAEKKEKVAKTAVANHDNQNGHSENGAEDLHEDVVTFADPYERFNRDTFAFNDFWDRNLLLPIAKLYKNIMPRPLRQGVTNFFNNLNTVSTIVDDILQLQFEQTLHDSWRLAINTTLGIGGLFDVADRMGLEYHENDFGRVLATWGWENSNYIVIPFYGSYTIRDGLSLPVDFFLLSAYQFIEPEKLRYGLYGLSVVDDRANSLKYEGLLDAAAVDKYTFVKNAYLQNRQYQLKHAGRSSLLDSLDNHELSDADVADEAQMNDN